NAQSSSAARSRCNRCPGRAPPLHSFFPPTQIRHHAWKEEARLQEKTDKADKADKSDKTIRIVLADSSRLTAMGIGQVIEKEPEMELVATASDGEEAVTKTLELEPDVLVIEADLPRLSGIKVTQRIRRELPHVGVVVLTAKDDEQTLFEAIRAGAAAYLNKDVEPAELIDAIRKARAGQFII